MILALLLSLNLNAVAEEKTCVVEGMACPNCVEMVKSAICGDRYSTCRVTLVDRKNHRGEIALATKDPAAKIDMSHVTAEISKLTYTVGTCVPKIKASRP